jgi:hypothetical protein
VIDTSHSRQKVWYAEELMADHETIIDGYQSAPVSINRGKPTTDHRYYPAKFTYHDYTVYERDPDTGQFITSHSRARSGWHEPNRFLKSDRYYLIWGTVKSSDTKYRFFSNYTMKNGPDDLLRKPGTYTVRVKYKVFNLSYENDKGMVFTPNNELLYSETLNVSAIANDHRQVDVLDKSQLIMVDPYAHGWIKRSWEKEYDAKVNKNLFDSIPVGIPTGASAVTVRTVYRVKEELGKLDED